MAIRRKTKEPRLAAESSSTRLYRGDYQGVRSLMSDGGKTEAEVIRQLVGEALRSRRLHAHGIDQTRKTVELAQKKVVGDLLAPLRAELEETRRLVERVEDRVAVGFDHVGRDTEFAARAARFLVVEVLICRQLLRDYVHTVYRVFMEKLGKPVAEVRKNFDARVEAFRAEAESALSSLGGEGGLRLSEMAGREGVFTEAEETPKA